MICQCKLRNELQNMVAGIGANPAYRVGAHTVAHGTFIGFRDDAFDPTAALRRELIAKLKLHMFVLAECRFHFGVFAHESGREVWLRLMHDQDVELNDDVLEAKINKLPIAGGTRAEPGTDEVFQATLCCEAKDEGVVMVEDTQNFGSSLMASVRCVRQLRIAFELADHASFTRIVTATVASTSCDVDRYWLILNYGVGVDHVS